MLLAGEAFVVTRPGIPFEEKSNWNEIVAKRESRPQPFPERQRVHVLDACTLFHLDEAWFREFIREYGKHDRERWREDPANKKKRLALAEYMGEDTPEIVTLHYKRVKGISRAKLVRRKA
jgi:hypothetical protein